jgi:hypothetical protein
MVSFSLHSVFETYKNGRFESISSEKNIGAYLREKKKICTAVSVMYFIAFFFFLASLQNYVFDQNHNIVFHDAVAVEHLPLVNWWRTAERIQMSKNPENVSHVSRNYTRALLYAYHESELCAINMKYLLDFGELRRFPDLLVVIIVSGHTMSVKVPRHLTNVRVVRRANSGLDFGAYAAGVQEIIRIADIRILEAMPSHYGFLNCGITGPFLPAYLPPTFDWFGALTKKLTATVHLVGSYISCLDTEQPIHRGGGPHVEGHSFFTDLEGLRVLVEEDVLRPMVDKVDAISNGEYGLTNAMARHGYTIDTPLYRYQAGPRRGSWPWADK